jgi:hypothetical protein
VTAYSVTSSLLSCLVYGGYVGVILEYGERYRLLPERALIAGLCVGIGLSLVVDLLNLKGRDCYRAKMRT